MANDLRVATARIGRRLRQQHTVGEPTPAEMSVLARLEEFGSCGLVALADAEQVSSSVVCTTLAGLQSRNLVAREPDPQDGRRVILSLTNAGRSQLHARRSALSRQVAAVLHERFEPDERDQLVAVIPLLQRLATEL